MLQALTRTVASLVTAIIFHQLFEGLSLGIRIATLPAAAARGAFQTSNLAQHLSHYLLPADVAGFSLLKPILALSFAVTTPIGIGIGLAVFEPGRSEGGEFDVSVCYTSTDGLVVLGQVPWMRDILALAPAPGPIVTFNRVCIAISHLTLANSPVYSLLQPKWARSVNLTPEYRLIS